MSDPLNRPRIDEPRTGVMSGAALNDWNPADMELPPEPALPREPIFSRRVLIGWALFALVAYFGVQTLKTVIKESVKQAAVYTTGIETTPDNREVIYVTPNGKLVITKDRQSGQITIRKRTNGHPVAPDPAAVAEAARAAAEAAVNAAAAGTIPAPATAPPAPAPKKR